MSEPSPREPESDAQEDQEDASNGRDPDGPDDHDHDGSSGAPAIPPAKSVDRCTPQPVLDLVYEVLGRPVGIDPCSNPRSIVKARRTVMLPLDGLSINWSEYLTGFVNPPFGKIEEPLWIQKAIQEANRGWEGILLLPSKTGAPWFEPLYQNSQCICFWGAPENDVEGRIWFHEEDGGATFNTEFVYLGPHYEKFARVFARVGHLVYPRHDQALTTRITGRTMPTVPYASTAPRDDLFKHAERELRTMRYHAFGVGVTNLPSDTTVREVLDRDDVPELRSLIEDLTVPELGQALLMLANEPEIEPPKTTRKKKTRKQAPKPENKNQLGLPVHSDGHAYKTPAERERFDERMYQSIWHAPEPPGRQFIMRQNPCTEHEYRSAIRRLKKAGRIEKVGDGKQAAYQVTHTPPRTEQDERTKTPHDGDPTGS